MARAAGGPRWRSALAALVAVAALPAAAAAQGVEAANRKVSVNYVYASQLGIGTYDIGGLSVDVFTLPLSFTRPVDGLFGIELPYAHGKDWTVSFEIPVSLGIYDFNAFDPEFGQLHIEQDTLAVVPGLQLDAQMTERWRLRPFGNIGFGKVVRSVGAGASGNDWFLIYTTGISSLYEVPFGDSDAYTFALGNAVTFAGNTSIAADVDFDENYWALETGLEVRRDLGFTLGDVGITGEGYRDVMPQVGLFFTYYWFPEPLTFTRFLDDPLKVQNQYEFGVALRAKEDWDLFFLNDPKIGFSYLTGDGLTVYRVNFGFPF